ncbi:MAG: helix-turn-helix domain-containing protein [Nitrospira sp. CR1.3]|nr:helix-turn-helix domain-containing protein [Nitrospira sp. CR1.3]
MPSISGVNIIPVTMFARRLKRLRTARRLTQVALAARVQVTQGYIAQLESGLQQDPSLSVLRRLAKALKVSVAELVR